MPKLFQKMYITLQLYPLSKNIGHTYSVSLASLSLYIAPCNLDNKLKRLL